MSGIGTVRGNERRSMLGAASREGEGPDGGIGRKGRVVSRLGGWEGDEYRKGETLPTPMLPIGEARGGRRVLPLMVVSLSRMVLRAVKVS